MPGRRKRRISREERQKNRIAWREAREFEQRQRFGSQGPAGPCRRLDPETLEVVGTVTRERPETRGEAP